MKKLLSIIIFGLLISESVHAKEVNLSCELSKYIEKKWALAEEQQIPLSKVSASDLKKFTLSFDMENEKFLGSNLIGPNEYKSVTFSSLNNMIYFMTKGYQADDITYYDTRLDRLTGELTRTIRPTEKFLKAQFENTGKAEIGYEQTKIYQCKLVEKLF
jgi:hypothetical protein|tara:strand:- start:163 stop:639 length:477 start_codon:yes stop_codon:yes gene_type:complete